MQKIKPYDTKSHLEYVNIFKYSDELSEEENNKLSKLAVLIVNTENKSKIINTIKPLNLNTCLFNGINRRKLKLHDTFNQNLKIAEYNNHYFMVDCTDSLDNSYDTDMISSSLTHLLLHNLIQFDEMYDKFLIIEDDTELLLDTNTIRKYLANIPNTFDIICVNSKFKWEDSIEPINDYYNVIKSDKLNASSISYIVSRTGSSKLLTYCRYDIRCSFDDLISNIYNTGLCDIIASDKFLFGYNVK